MHLISGYSAQWPSRPSRLSHLTTYLLNGILSLNGKQFLLYSRLSLNGAELGGAGVAASSATAMQPNYNHGRRAGAFFALQLERNLTLTSHLTLTLIIDQN